MGGVGEVGERQNRAHGGGYQKAPYRASADRLFFQGGSLQPDSIRGIQSNYQKNDVHAIGSQRSGGHHKISLRMIIVELGFAFQGLPLS